MILSFLIGISELNGQVLPKLCCQWLTHRHLALNVQQCRQCFEIVVGLQDQPRSCITTKMPGQPGRRICRYGPAFFYYFMNTSGRNTQSDRQRVHTQPERHQIVFAQDFTRMNGAHAVYGACHTDPLVIIHNLGFDWPKVSPFVSAGANEFHYLPR